MDTQDGRTESMAKTIRTLEAKIEVLHEQKDLMTNERALLVEKADGV